MSDPPYYADGSHGYYDVTPGTKSMTFFHNKAEKLSSEYYRMYGYSRIPEHVFFAKAQKIYENQLTKRQAFTEIRRSYPDKRH